MITRYHHYDHQESSPFSPVITNRTISLSSTPLRQVAQVGRLEEELQVTKRQLDTFDRLYGMGGRTSPILPHNTIFEKDFECPVCYEVI